MPAVSQIASSVMQLRSYEAAVSAMLATARQVLLTYPLIVDALSSVMPSVTYVLTQ